MSRLEKGKEFCDTCGKPYIAALNGVSCRCVKEKPTKAKPPSYSVLKAEHEAMYKVLKFVNNQQCPCDNWGTACNTEPCVTVELAREALSLVDGRGR